jgi:hypothetical protein
VLLDHGSSWMKPILKAGETGSMRLFRLYFAYQIDWESRK